MIRKVVRVKWVDSCSSYSNWVLTDEIEADVKPIYIITFGIVLQECDEFVTIAQNYGMEPEQCCNLMTIPRGCITKYEVIEEIEISE